MKSIKSYIFFLFFLLLFFSEIIAQYFPVFSYVDEIISLISIIYLIINKDAKKNMSFYFYIFVLVVLGLISNYCSRVNTNLFPILIDAFTTFKAFLIYISFKNLNFSKNDKIYSLVYNFCKCFILVSIIFLVLNTISIVNMTEAIRYNLKEYKFIFINAGSFGYYLMAIIPFFEKKKKSSFYIILILILIASTLKGPQLLFVLIYLYYKNVNNYKFLRYMRIFIFPIVIIIGFLISNYQIQNYFVNENSARYKLTEKAFVTANNYFPLGSGFATYGSEMSRRYYSKLYYDYHFNEIYGLNPVYSSYLNDNYWQMIVAQLGYVGLIVNILFLCRIFKDILYRFKNTSIYNWAKSMIICVIVGSLGSAYITGCAFATIMFALCILIGDGKKNEK